MKIPSLNTLGRRKVFAGAGAAGALAAVATVLPSPAPTEPAAQAAPQPAQGGGYRLTEHIKRYYASART